MTSPVAVIAEDEPLLRQEIREQVQALWPDLRIAAEVGDGIEAIQAIDQWRPDILFLDIQMPGASGIDVARYASGRAHVVFITAFDSFALQAFEQGALDYVLKPISSDRIRLTVERLQRRLREPPADLRGLTDLLKSAIQEGPQFLKWLTVPKGRELHVVAVADISYLRADNKYTTLFTRTASFLCTSTLKDMKDKLDPTMFWQIHRSIVVNVGAIDTIYRSFRGSLEVKLKERAELLPVSAAHAHLFRQK
jgi:DNA-binding LytR/AlgR family response regulator